VIPDSQDWGALLLDPIEILGIESLADGFATIRSRFKTLPLDQGGANELRTRLLAALVGRGYGERRRADAERLRTASRATEGSFTSRHTRTPGPAGLPARIPSR
jgi:hypothetical protein